MGGIITCCYHCVAPKRHPGCHSTCPEYLKQRAEHDELKAVADKQKFISNGIRSQKTTAVIKALKGKR